MGLEKSIDCIGFEKNYLSSPDLILFLSTLQIYWAMVSSILIFVKSKKTSVNLKQHKRQKCVKINYVSLRFHSYVVRQFCFIEWKFSRDMPFWIRFWFSSGNIYIPLGNYMYYLMCKPFFGQQFAYFWSLR